MLHAHDLAAEVEALLVHVEHDDLGAGQLGEFQRGQADGAGADDQARFVGLEAGAIDGVTADGQRLHQGELLEGELARDVQLAGRHEEARPQAAVAMDAERLVLLAAVGVAAAAGVALLAVDVRLDRAAIARPDVGHARADGEHLDAQLVARDARIAEEGHLAEVAADVGAADADPVDADQGLARAGLLRGGDVDAFPVSWAHPGTGLSSDVLISMGT